jgi:hypothetical protein
MVAEFIEGCFLSSNPQSLIRENQWRSVAGFDQIFFFFLFSRNARVGTAAPACPLE